MRPYKQMRPKGMGTITRDGRRNGWSAYGPHSKETPKKWLGKFDTYREAERALAAFIAESQKAV